MGSIRPSSNIDFYQIRVRGILDEKWVDWFDGFVMSWTGQNETLLTGRVMDQAELHGILSKVRDLGLELLLVKKVDGYSPGKSAAKRGGC